MIDQKIVTGDTVIRKTDGLRGTVIDGEGKEAIVVEWTHLPSKLGPIPVFKTFQEVEFRNKLLKVFGRLQKL